MKNVKVYLVQAPDDKHIVISTLFQEEAERECNRFYAQKGKICDIFEHDYSPKDWTLKQ